jgi:hypothetical protein
VPLLEDFQLEPRLIIGFIDNYFSDIPKHHLPDVSQQTKMETIPRSQLRQLMCYVLVHNIDECVDQISAHQALLRKQWIDSFVDVQ